MEKILVICGPTASGKTALALKIANVTNGEILSVDSRQVYKNLDIGTGKDIPNNFVKKNSKIYFRNELLDYYTDGNTRIWGYDLINPEDEFSISDLRGFSELIISDIFKRGKLPIIVGGSGLYIKSLTEPIDTVDIPRNLKLREFLETRSVDEIYDILAQNDPIKAGSLNVSDSKNKRRLVRAVEVSFWDKKQIKPLNKKAFNYDFLFIGLDLVKESYRELIAKRVAARIEAGFQEEVERLLMSGITWTDQSMQSIGYHQIKDYFYGKIDKQEFMEKWIKSEINYVKRQKTWFKKEKRIIWFNPSSRDFYDDVENTVIRWHNERYDFKN